MSQNAFGSDLAQPEAGTFRFRDPLNKDRRFLPLRLDDTEPRASLAQFLYIDWRAESRAPIYQKLLEACRPPQQQHTPEREAARALVGEVISTVALAGQISREFNVSDHGIDMEIEFKYDNGEASGQKLYLQLKSGDSYLRERKRDGAEVFTIKDERHARYWMAQKFPVLLVIRNSEGQVRWMEIRDWLNKATNKGKTPVNQILFEGERFDVMSVRRWRDRLLSKK